LDCGVPDKPTNQEFAALTRECKHEHLRLQIIYSFACTPGNSELLVIISIKLMENRPSTQMSTNYTRYEIERNERVIIRGTNYTTFSKITFSYISIILKL
jgi:hypothetical protein